MRKIVLLLCAFFIPCLLSAQTDSDRPERKITKYVSGPATITMRSGQGTKHKAIKEIPVGTELEIIKTEKKHSFVRTKDGTQGWILDLFLTEKPIEKLELTASNKMLSQDLTKLRLQLKKLEDENQRIRHVAEHPLKIADENSNLVRNNISLEVANDLLSQELRTIGDSSEKQWFLMGAGTILFGMLIGLLLPKLHRRRKSDWEKL